MVSLSLRARLVRRGLRRRAAQKLFPDIPINQMPILFGNSFPKSGTHLLTQILAGFATLGPVVESGLPPVLTFEGETGRPRPLKIIMADLARFLSGDIGYGHLHAFSEVVAALCRDGVAPYFIYRDPRDVVVSHVFYVTDLNNRHAHHDYYVNQLTDFNERLSGSIQGRPELEFPFPNIRARFEPYLPWLERAEVLSLRFEDLTQDPQTQLGRIFDHAAQRGFISSQSRAQSVARLREAIRPEESPTFRSGQAGGWKDHFTSQHKELFKDVSGDLLMRLGYEQNQNW
ncbi:MAG: sulfotransferase domain-containing protein [Anaerolineales bacterium]